MVAGFTLKEEKGLSVLSLRLQMYRRQRCGGDEQVRKKKRAPGVRFSCQ